MSILTLHNNNNKSILCSKISRQESRRFTGKNVLEGAKNAMGNALAQSPKQHLVNGNNSNTNTAEGGKNDAALSIDGIIKPQNNTYEVGHYLNSDQAASKVQPTPSGDPGFTAVRYAHLGPQSAQANLKTESYASFQGKDYEDLDEECKILPKEDVSLPVSPKIIGVKLKQETVDESQNPPPSHEATHNLIGVDDEKRGLVTISHMLTSAKKHFLTKEENIVIDPKRNYQAEDKPQRITSLQSPRVFDPSTETKTWEKDQKLTEYLNQSAVYPKVKEAIETTKPSIPVIRRHKDDTTFFTETGINIKDNE